MYEWERGMGSICFPTLVRLMLVLGLQMDVIRIGEPMPGETVSG
jgi:hypothetical protein